MTNGLRRVKERKKAWKEFATHNNYEGECIDLSIKQIWSYGFNSGWKRRGK